MKILFSPTSPYVRKCMVAAHELGLDGQIELLANKAHPIVRDEELIAANPLGKVPTLITDAGRVLYDSRVICEYLNEKAGGDLFPGGEARWEALTLHALGDGMLDAALIARCEDVYRPESHQWPVWRAAQLGKVENALSHLERSMHLLEGRVDIGSIAIGCALWYADFRFGELAWRDRHPRVGEWYGQFSARPSMKMTWSLPD